MTVFHQFLLFEMRQRKFSKYWVQKLYSCQESFFSMGGHRFWVFFFSFSFPFLEDFPCGQENILIFPAYLGPLAEGKDLQSRFFCNGKRNGQESQDDSSPDSKQTQESVLKLYCLYFLQRAIWRMASWHLQEVKRKRKLLPCCECVHVPVLCFQITACGFIQYNCELYL